MAAVAEGRVGFCTADVKEAGPVQLYVAPVIAGVDKDMADPAQTGELAVTAGAAGVEFTVTATVPATLVHPPAVTVKL